MKKTYFERLSDYLTVTKNRFYFVLPSMTIWFISIVNIWMSAVFKTPKIPYVLHIHVIFAFLFVVSCSIILYADHKRLTKFLD